MFTNENIIHDTEGNDSVTDQDMVVTLGGLVAREHQHDAVTHQYAVVSHHFCCHDGHTSRCCLI